MSHVKEDTQHTEFNCFSIICGQLLLKVCEKVGVYFHISPKGKLKGEPSSTSILPLACLHLTEQRWCDST